MSDKVPPHPLKRCRHSITPEYRCGSFAFNLWKEAIDQGELCDVHYWEMQYLKLKLEAAKLVHQIEIGDFVDRLGHQAKMLSPYLALKRELENCNQFQGVDDGTSKG